MLVWQDISGQIGTILRLKNTTCSCRRLRTAPGPLTLEGFWPFDWNRQPWWGTVGNVWIWQVFWLVSSVPCYFLPCRPVPTKGHASSAQLGPMAELTRLRPLVDIGRLVRSRGTESQSVKKARQIQMFPTVRGLESNPEPMCHLSTLSGRYIVNWVKVQCIIFCSLANCLLLIGKKSIAFIIV